MNIADNNKRESFFHTVAILSKVLKIGSKKNDEEVTRLLKIYGIFEEIFKSESKIDAFAEYSKIAKLIDKQPSFKTLTILSDEFPEHLKNIYGATGVLYTRGNTDLFNEKSMGVVGTRKIEKPEHIETGEELCQRLIDKQYTIVSGLARGCDTLAHRYAVEHRGKTLAVLGTPLNKCGISDNKSLQEKIAEEHLLVSQYPIGIRTFPSHFAHRNKTTVALSTDGLCVILADDKSGTRHAIKETIEKNKQLYVLKQNLEQGYQWPEQLKGKYKII